MTDPYPFGGKITYRCVLAPCGGGCLAAGTLEGAVRSVRCRYRAGERGPPRVYLACLAVTSQTAVLRIGQPFVAGSPRDGRYAWCRENPGPTEGASGTSISVPLPAACTA